MENVGLAIALIKALKGNGGGGSSLPAVTSSDNGKVLAVKDGAWAASEQGKKFIVTLTPTALDYSGTMDKTVAEINEAYEAGMEIVCRVITGYETYMEVLCTATGHNSNYTYPSFNSYIITDDGHYIYAFTGMTSDGTKATYSTSIYSLTPAS